MNQIVRHDCGFAHPQRLVSSQGPASLLHLRPDPSSRRQFVKQQLDWPGWLSWLAEGWKHYRCIRRTRVALDSLSHEQLKDIGFRRVAEGSYDRLP